MQTIRRLLLGFGALGCGVSLVSTIVSVASTTGNLPSWLFGRAQLFASFSRVGGVPVEFVITAVFGASSLIVWDLSRRDNRNPYGHAFVIAALLLATTLALVNGRRQCVALWIMSACAGGMLVLSSIADRTPLRQMLLNVLRDLRASVAKSGVVLAAAAYVLAFVVVGQSISHRLSAATPMDSGSSNLVRWFDVQPSLDLPDLRAVNARKLVIFTDYQCPVCSLMVPQYRSVVSGLQHAGRRIEIEIRDFPLEQECNTAVPTALHPQACEAAAASRLLAQEIPLKRPQFEAWLYAQRGQLSMPVLAKRLADEGVRASLSDRYRLLLSAVAADTRFGQAAGVYSTPTVFLDGVKLPTLTARGLETLLTSSRARN